jgi:hypothetical protein
MENRNFVREAAGKLMEGKNKKSQEILRQGMEYWSGNFAETVGVINGEEAPIVIAALRETAEAYANLFPGATNVAEDIRQMFKREEKWVI